MEAWLDNPVLLEPDADAEYAKILEIDLDTIDEPLLACPNDPDDIKKLSEVAGTHVDEVFVGSCMTNIGHFRAVGSLLEKFAQPVPTRLWIAPPTRMDQAQLVEEGVYAKFAVAGARTEMPGCSLCMGNQASARPGATVVSTSTRNFPNRLGKDTNVFLSSAEVAAVASMLGRLPTKDEYLGYAKRLEASSGEIYKYLNFDQMTAFTEAAESAKAHLPILQ
jgi:aconitate hydratase 2/2-methylisocitrate dehydratase